MSNYTYATIIINDNMKELAQLDFPEYFNYKYKDTSGNIFWISSGPFGNDELEKIINDAKWEYKIFFGNDVQRVIIQQELNNPEQ